NIAMTRSTAHFMPTAPQNNRNTPLVVFLTAEVNVLLQPDCVSCIQTALLSAIRELTSDEAEIKGLLSELMQLPSLRGPAWDMTSPHVIETALAKISQVFGTSDPFQAMKERQMQG